MVHGSFDGAPEEKGNKCRYEDIYVFLRLNAKRAMRAMDTPLGIIGHTHDPLLVRRRGAFIREITYTLVGSEGVGVYRNGFSFDQNSRALVNFGSVGQPRDGDPRAAYGLVTIEARKVMLEFRRVPYNIPAIQQKMWAEGLPDSLAKRLAEGT